MLACWVFAGFLLLVNAAAYGLTLHDKKQAQRHGSRAQRRRSKGHDRIPERTFMALALFGGGLGGLLGCYAVRHKTRKPRFMVPFVLLTLVGAALAVAWFTLVC